VNFINGTINRLWSFIQPLIALKDQVANILALLKQDNYSKLNDLIQDLYNNLAAFVNNPTGYILNIIYPVFIDYFCYALAYALGTETETLPARPSWTYTPGDPNNPSPVVTPPSTGELVKPLDTLWVSGYRFTGTHRGTDYGISYGANIYAAHNGVITYAGWDSTGYGIRIDVKSTKYYTLYGHLANTVVTMGAQVKAGQVIAHGDTTGNSTGNHLHFELAINGAKVNPELYLPK
jgi:murein DD-endopeptidase MepM/ murein hydrolase activator NlpD